MKLYQFRQCEVEFALTGEGIAEDESLLSLTYDSVSS